MKIRFLNANAIKIIAAIAMIVDHVGFMFFPQALWLRAIGRISMPLFAFAIAEGCRYTHDKLRYFLLIFIFGIAYALVFHFVYRQIYLSIFTTFSFSILAVYALQNFKRSIFSNEGVFMSVLSGALSFFYVLFLYFLNRITAFGNTPFIIDYGFWGCMLPVFAALGDCKGVGLKGVSETCEHYYIRLVFYTFGVILMSLHAQISVSYFAMLSIAVLAFYNERKGKLPLKYFFYVFYPAHMALLYFISVLI